MTIAKRDWRVKKANNAAPKKVKKFNMLEPEDDKKQPKRIRPHHLPSQKIKE